MQGERGKQSEGASLDELFRTFGPLFHLVIGVRCAIEKMKADSVANGPIVEVATPAIHLSRRDARGFVYKSRQHPRFKIARSPKPCGELMVPAEILGQLV